MRIPIGPLVLLILAPLAGAGCGRERDADRSEALPRSPYDAGPRAGEFPVAIRLAEKGEAIFKVKGCTACHHYSVRLTGPPLKGVTQRRTTKWMEQQILHPEVMLAEDPITKELYDEYMVRMANQGLLPEEAAAVIEYLKRLDEDSLGVAAIPPPSSTGGAGTGPEAAPR